MKSHTQQLLTAIPRHHYADTLHAHQNIPEVHWIAHHILRAQTGRGPNQS